ncbi:MAG: aminotransferase class I/II-fold pyridoxal phosphate-dependent enzyme [Candidatus Lokiarchaeota archaeon]|nr:aminotransferase class I/II-fold pyridoxal phosphate-dependent enzyme [Candidatus Lokiarchaeota archaeon]
MAWPSHHMERIPASGTLKMFDLANRLEAEGKKVYHFEVGQPDFDTPENIIKAAKNALDAGHTRYISARGHPPLRKAIADMYTNRGMDFDPEKQVIVTPGAKMALFGAILSTIDRGDDVLVLAPAWPTYRVLTRTAGGIPVDVSTDSDYRLDRESLKAALNKDVRGLVINSPNNPTGGVINKDDLRFIHDLAIDHDIVVFSDEIYEELVYDGFKQPSMLEIDPALEHTVIINGFSKSYAMTGWRLGYAIGNEVTIDSMVRIQQNTTSCATSFVQYAGVEALEGDQSGIEKMRKAYQKRRNRIVDMFCDIEGVGCVNPAGAFYVFPDFSYYGISSATLAEMLLLKVGVTSVPGAVFGTDYDSNLRFSFATDMDTIEEGVSRVGEYLQTLV